MWFWNSFTGGDTGISISKKAGMIPLQMELGGKDCCIVLEDADLELAANNVIKGGYSYRFVAELLWL
jgi:glyceraldehyde-3-phosphate dehydrogenase (NADP+)